MGLVRYLQHWLGGAGPVYETGGQPDGGAVQWPPGRRPDRLVGGAGGQCTVVAVCTAPLRADARRRLAQELASPAFDPGHHAAGGRRTFCQVGHPPPSAPRAWKVPRAGGGYASGTPQTLSDLPQAQAPSSGLRRQGRFPL